MDLFEQLIFQQPISKRLQGELKEASRNEQIVEANIIKQREQIIKDKLKEGIDNIRTKLKNAGATAENIEEAIEQLTKETEIKDGETFGLGFLQGADKTQDLEKYVLIFNDKSIPVKDRFVTFSNYQSFLKNADFRQLSGINEGIKNLGYNSKNKFFKEIDFNGKPIGDIDNFQIFLKKDFIDGKINLKGVKQNLKRNDVLIDGEFNNMTVIKGKDIENKKITRKKPKRRLSEDERTKQSISRLKKKGDILKKSKFSKVDDDPIEKDVEQLIDAVTDEGTTNQKVTDSRIKQLIEISAEFLDSNLTQTNVRNFAEIISEYTEEEVEGLFDALNDARNKDNTQAIDELQEQYGAIQTKKRENDLLILVKKGKKDLLNTSKIKENFKDLNIETIEKIIDDIIKIDIDTSKKTDITRKKNLVKLIDIYYDKLLENNNTVIRESNLNKNKFSEKFDKLKSNSNEKEFVNKIVTEVQFGKMTPKDLIILKKNMEDSIDRLTAKKSKNKKEKLIKIKNLLNENLPTSKKFENSKFTPEQKKRGRKTNFDLLTELQQNLENDIIDELKTDKKFDEISLILNNKYKLKDIKAIARFNKISDSGRNKKDIIKRILTKKFN